MGNSESLAVEGPGAKALLEMTKPKRIEITDGFWFELLKVQLPGSEKPGFFDAHYADPLVLEGVVKSAYFLQLVATNEHTANFRTFLRFWAQLLHHYRSASDKPCPLSAVVNLSLLNRCLLKLFTAESLTVQELLFRLEQVPIPEPSKAEQPQVFASYRGQRLPVERPAPSEAASTVLATLAKPFLSQFPEDAAALQDADFCMLRLFSLGETLSAGEAAGPLSEPGHAEEVVLCPGAVPNAQGSVVRGVFLEVVDFLVHSSFGAANSAAPAADSDKARTRNGYTPALTMRLQALLLEILLLLSAAVARPCECEEEKRLVRSAPYLAAGEEAVRPAAGAARASTPVKNGKAEAEAARTPEPKLPGVGEASLPFLKALQEVLQQESADGAEAAAHDGAPATNGTTPAAVPTAKSETPDPDHGLRVQVFLATLLNFIWLEPVAGLLPNPPKEVLQLVKAQPSTDSSEGTVKSTEISRMYLASSELMPGLPSGYVGDEGAGSGEAASAGKALAKRALLVLLLLLFYDSKEHPGLMSAFASLADPRIGPSEDCAYANLSAPLHFPRLLRSLLQKLQEPGYPILLYGLVVRTPSFRRYCCANPEKVLPTLLEALSALPSGADAKTMVAAPPAASALLIVLLCLTGDRGFCEHCSVVHLEDARSVLGASQRSIRDISLSSLMVAVLLRVAHWNFGACRDAFFNRAVAGILGNLAGHGVEHVHWHTATRMLEVAGLLARNAVKSPTPARGAADEMELHRARMVKALLRSLLRLVSSCLRSPRVTTNTQLVYALQKDYPSQFTQLEADPEMGPPLIHARTATDWFEAQCPPSEDGSVAVEEHLARLEEASARLPAELMTLASVAGASVSAFAETEDVSAYFLPSIWRAALKLIPEHVCWSPPAKSAASKS